MDQVFSLPWLLGISGVFATFLIPLGFGALSMTKVSRESFRIARACFIASGVAPAITVLYAASQFQMIYWQRVCVLVIGGLAMALPIRYLLRLVNENEKAHKEASQPIAEPAPFVQEQIMPMYTPDFSDPAYDRFWPESWRRKKFLAAGKKIKSGVPPLRALQEVDADELSTNDELVRLCEDLKAHGFSHPFEDDAYPFPKLLWLEVLKEAKNRHIDLGDKEDTLKYLDDLAESRFSLPIQSKPKQQLRIEALEPIPDLLNLTQLSWYEAANVIFTGDAAVSVKNLLPSQGIDLVNFRLLQISPPMKAVKAYKPSTLDAVLKRIDFGEDVPSTLLGGKTADVRLFKVTRPLAAKTLKDIKIEFYGKWPEGYYSVFTPQDRHQLVVEVTGSGASREEATFEFHFSCKENEPVFSIKTIRSAVGKA